ncbi:hypothetical protein BJ508DRAFT_314822 [Ascobolus immersus RN42]|uniref:Uncharacterized protein n=1 Tax=Ascobolus immersus RN42 TaxID=1160509 RepID=A0A3N4HJL2_ASCIM|nr:hypothetical protein BJ508DRAFT_314822 [Ascobolus immersus RN42]
MNNHTIHRYPLKTIKHRLSASHNLASHASETLNALLLVYAIDDIEVAKETEETSMNDDMRATALALLKDYKKALGELDARTKALVEDTMAKYESEEVDEVRRSWKLGGTRKAVGNLNCTCICTCGNDEKLGDSDRDQQGSGSDSSSLASDSESD